MVGGKLLGGGSNILLKAIIFQRRTKIKLFEGRHFTCGPGQLFMWREYILRMREKK